MSIADRQGRFLAVNRRAVELSGYSREELLEMTIRELIPPEDLDRFPLQMERLEGGGIVVSERCLRLKAGQRLWVEVSSRILSDGHLFSIVRDISVQRQVEASLKESERKYRELVENANCIIERWNPQGRITFMNEFGLAFFGFTEGELIGRHLVGTIVPPSESTGRDLAGLMARICQDPAAYELNVNENMRRDGSRVWVAWTNKAVADPRGRLIEIFSVGTDITARMQAEKEKERLQAQLLQSQKMESVGRLAGGVAHDFNNMLQAILGHVELGLLRTDPGHPVRASLEAIGRAAAHSADLTRQLLAFARKQTVAPQVLDLNDLVARTLQMLRRLIGEDIDLVWMPGAALWPLRIDPVQIDQILANLCVNARDAIVDVGRITIETENVTLDAEFCARHPECAPGAYVRLAVSDTGCGMTPEVMAHLFEPFFTTKGVGQGTGLGLATVYGIVKQNEGLVIVASQAGQGSTFTIYLPRHGAGDPVAAQPAAAAPKLPRGRGETVLLVEDEAAILELGREMLSALGYRVLAAASPSEALARAEDYAGRIDLLVSDVVMPGMNGREMARRLAARLPGLRCLFISGYTADVIAHRDVLEEGVLFLQKPFGMGDLALKVRQALES
jgi:PAS domain S-box-containing protein